MLGPAAPPRQEAFRLCGSAIPPAFISARDHVWIFFHSDASSSGQAQGFRLSYIRGDTSNSIAGHHRALSAPRGRLGPEQHPPSACSLLGLLQEPRQLSTVVGQGLVMLLPQGALESLKVTDPTPELVRVGPHPFTQITLHLRSGT